MIGNPSQDKKADAKTAVDDLVKHSRDFSEDAKRCKAFLNDSCPSSKPQISALVSAVEHGIVSQILKESGPDHKVLDPTLIHKFGKTLHEDYALDLSMAQWATETWAEALEVYQPTNGSVTNGPGTTGSVTNGPVTNGPETTGSVTNGPGTNGPETTGSVTTGPETTGPETTGSVTNGSVTTGPGTPNIFEKFRLWIFGALLLAVGLVIGGLAGPRLFELLKSLIPHFTVSPTHTVSVPHTPTVPPPEAKAAKEIAQLKGHRGSVRSVAFSPDSQTLATSGEDGIIRLWNIKGQPFQPLYQFKGSQNAINSINFSPDGQQLVSDAGGKIRLLNLQGKLLREFVGSQQLIRSVKFSPDGKQLASTGDDGTIHLWDLQGQSPEKKWKADRKRVWDLAFSSDGKQLASAEASGNVGLWDLKGKSLHQFTEHKSPVLSVAFSPDGKQLVSGCNVGMIRSWSLPDYQMKKMFQVNRAQLNSVAFSQDSKLILSGDNEGNIKLWKLNTQQQSPFWKAHQNSIIRKVIFSPDGKMFATAADDGIVKLWQLE